MSGPDREALVGGEDARVVQDTGEKVPTRSLEVKPGERPRTKILQWETLRSARERMWEMREGEEAEAESRWKSRITRLQREREEGSDSKLESESKVEESDYRRAMGGVLSLPLLDLPLPLGSHRTLSPPLASLRFCGLRREALGFKQQQNLQRQRSSLIARASNVALVSAPADSGNDSPSTGGFDYDLVIIGAGVGGHGAALHAVEKGLKTAIIEGDVVGGTCVNRGCVPSKALLAVSGRLRELQNEQHLRKMGLQVSSTLYDRQGVADHANNLASNIRNNLTNSMKNLGVDILTGVGQAKGEIRKNWFIGHRNNSKKHYHCYGSIPFVPNGIEVDGKTVFTSDHALKLEWVPDWIAIVGSGYIGLEFSDVYTALGSEVTFVEALDQIMPGFDPEIGKMAQRILINPRKIDYHTGVFAKKDGKPVMIELIDAKTKEPKDTLEVGVATQRGFVPVDERMQVIDTNGKVIPHLYCIGDANGKLMLAHAASAQGISVVEQICGKGNVLNHMSIPAACFTHPEISMVGYTEPQAREKAEKEGFEISIAKTSFKANTKALAENEGEGIAKLIYRPDTGEILGVHILGLHAADLIHEASNAIAMGTRIQDIKFAVHAHPTLSEVLDELFKAAKVNTTFYSASEPVSV
ncbi:hypothetical protein QJS10_CPA05g00257 [Acorus calamus]|uniref:Dihydrolipoyl dehydrogenase n=2 Tax=Magnoliopsida TaxID=3398 RepID=A0AAV9ERB7_ACOCL|nr:hypothetical protein QJS10_CPA05g00257 [Acorus calamus]